jgi:hypothetical protein
VITAKRTQKSAKILEKRCFQRIYLLAKSLLSVMNHLVGAQVRFWGRLVLKAFRGIMRRCANIRK